MTQTEAVYAMLRDRPYRPAMSREEALAELKIMAGIQFDPRVVSVLGRILGGKG